MAESARTSLNAPHRFAATEIGVPKTVGGGWENPHLNCACRNDGPAEGAALEPGGAALSVNDDEGAPWSSQGGDGGRGTSC